MPQIGWFEILIIVVLALIIIGPKDLPLMLKKVGSWIGTIKNYFNEVQNDIADLDSSENTEVSLDKDISNKKNDKKNE